MAGFTQLTAGFTVPAIGSNVTISVLDSSWMSPTQVVYIQSAGYYEVQSLPDTISAIVKNLGYTGNAAPTTVIANSQGVSPGGLVGETGATGLGTLNSISPTTTKGDIMADNGANSPSAGVVRVAVGSNGKALVADSAAAAGVSYATITPNTVTSDNNIPRYDGTSGNPMPLQDSLLLITDDGSIQSTPTGGNARGSKATDLQVARALAAQVASGSNSVIVGGDNNTASGQYSAILGGSGNICSATGSTIGAGAANTASGASSSITGGDSNVASGLNSAVAGGSQNTASGADSAIAGGVQNTASGALSFVGAGQNNAASGINSVVLGGTDNTASGDNSSTIGGQFALSDKYGQVSRASGNFAAAGDAQASELIFRNSTTDATPTVLYLDGGSSPERASISTSSSWAFRGLVIGRRDNGDSAGWEFTGVIHNNGGTTALTAAIVATLIAADAGCAATWGVAGSIAVTADNANDALQIEVTGTAGNNIRWVATVKSVEVNY